MRVLLLTFVAWSAMAQTASPSVVSKVDPQYTDVARIIGVNGTILIKLTIDERGTPLDPRVIRGLGYGLDESALAAVRAWKFKPGLKYGVPVPAQATIEVNFRLLTTRLSTLGPMTFPSDEGTATPVMTEVSLPPDTGDGKAELEFTVTPGGETENYKVTGNLPPSEEKLLLEAMRDWKFRPAIRNGGAVSIRGKVTYSVGMHVNQPVR
jgi:TonB family protein